MKRVPTGGKWHLEKAQNSLRALEGAMNTVRSNGYEATFKTWMGRAQAEAGKLTKAIDTANKLKLGEHIKSLK